MRKSKHQVPKNQTKPQDVNSVDEKESADRPPFERGFWSGKKGSAIGNSAASQIDEQHASPIFSKQASESAATDLRKGGPFAKEKVVAPKAYIDTAEATNQANQAFSPRADVRTIGGNNPAVRKQILQLDDFEPQAKAWRRNQKEPAAPRVHPNPTPVVSGKGKKAGASFKPQANQNAAGSSTSGRQPYAPPHISQSSPSIVMPLVMIFTLIVLIGGGYFYLSNLAATNSGQSDLAARERQVKLVETMLLNLDYQPGIMDGKIDRPLTAAVRAFQRDSLLPEDGLITPQLIEELEAILKIYESS